MEQMVYRRIWCKECNDFTIHEIQKDEKLNCNFCGTEYTEVYLKDIPEDKLEEQRDRYRLQERKKLMNLYSGFLNPYTDIFRPPISKHVVLESDAGQKEIDERKRRERAKRLAEYRERQEKKKKLQEKFKNVHRNDKCLCGSGKKYKHCCLQQIRSL